MKAPMAALFISGVVSGCASSGQFPGAAADGAPGAIVRTTGGTGGSLFAVTVPRLGTAKDVRLFRVNRERVNAMGSTDSVRLSPGEHRVTVSCTFRVDGRQSQGYGEASLNVLDGHTYQLDATPPCNVSVTDLGKQQ
jgi:hypothetical protein